MHTTEWQIDWSEMWDRVLEEDPPLGQMTREKAKILLEFHNRYRKDRDREDEEPTEHIEEIIRGDGFVMDFPNRKKR